MIIAIDFDDTITLPSTFPTMGKLNPKAIEVIKKLKAQGNILILWTCREGIYLDEAVNALHEVGITFDYINEGITNTRKVIADCYIDDRAFGANIDWYEIERQLTSV